MSEQLVNRVQNQVADLLSNPRDDKYYSLHDEILALSFIGESLRKIVEAIDDLSPEGRQAVKVVLEVISKYPNQGFSEADVDKLNSYDSCMDTLLDTIPFTSEVNPELESLLDSIKLSRNLGSILKVPEFSEEKMDVVKTGVIEFPNRKDKVEVYENGYITTEYLEGSEEGESFGNPVSMINSETAISWLEDTFEDRLEWN